jgi:sarcosine oxidase, subunit beta
LSNVHNVDVLVIGAGAIGCSVAYYLAERGAGKVLVVDRGRAGDGSSSRAAGGLRAQFSTEINIRFSLLSQPFFKHASEVLGAPISYEEAGYIFLARSDVQAQAFQRNVELQRSLGVDAHWLSPDDLERHWPYLQLDGVIAASWCPTDALIDQVEFMQALVERVRRSSVEIREGVTVESLLADGDRVIGAATSDGVIHAGVTVLAAGVWSPTLSASIGLDLPIAANRREIFTTTPVASLPDEMPFIADFDVGSYVRRDRNGFRISGRLEQDSTSEADVDMSGGPRTLAWAASLLPELASARVTGGWSGLTEVTPDHHALLGFVDGRPGLIVATGFSGHGLMHAPATGLLVSEMILDGAARTLDIDALSPLRFERGEALAETMVAPAHEQGDIVARPTSG